VTARGQTTITLTNRLAELERVAAELAAFAQRERLATKVAFDLALAVDEVLTNVIRYAYDGDAAREIAVRIVRDDAVLTVEIEDDGRPFDPRTIAAPDVSSPAAERPIGGLGMHLVRAVMERVEYRRERDKNLLRMTKALAPASPVVGATRADLEIAETRVDEVTVLAVAGRLDGRNADALEARLATALASSTSRVVVDLAALDYVSSAGLRVLLVAAKRVRGRGALALSAPKDFIRGVLDVAGVASLVTIHADRDVAVAHVRGAIR
jgi:anti-anti-sigma factor